MKTPKRPAGGWPWEQPGYRFSIDWPPGFVPQPHRPDLLTDDEKRKIAAKGREKQLANGFTGGIYGLSNRADKALDEQLAHRNHRWKK